MFPLNKNTIALSFVAIIVLGFFIAGLFDVLDYFIIKVLLITGTVAIVIATIAFLFKNNAQKNRLDDSQDDSY